MDFRVAYLIEARKCLRYLDGQDIAQPQFWANLLGAVANAAIAGVSDSVALSLRAEEDRQKRVNEHIRKQLN